MNEMHPTMRRVYEMTKQGQSELGRFLNLSPQNISNWEKRGISKDGLKLIAETFNLSTDWVLTGDGSPYKNKPTIDKGFALIIKGRSMWPEFKPNEIIFVEPMCDVCSLKDGDLVVVSCNDDSEATFKQLVIGETSDDVYLKPLNPEWPEQRLQPMGECRLVGKVIGKYVRY